MRSLIFLLLFSSQAFGSFAPECTCEISYDEETLIRKAPFYGLYDYSQFGALYYARDIIEAGNKEGVDLSHGGFITSMFFQYAGWVQGYTANHQTVKISHTNANQIERGPHGGGSTNIDTGYSELDLTDTTIVIDNFTFIFNNMDESGWKEIGHDNHDPKKSISSFNTPFMWDGNSNILISWENRDGSWTSGYGNLIGGGGQTMRSHSWFSDDTYPSRASTNNSQVPNIRLHIIPNATNPIPLPASLYLFLSGLVGLRIIKKFINTF